VSSAIVSLWGAVSKTREGGVQCTSAVTHHLWSNIDIATRPNRTHWRFLRSARAVWDFGDRCRRTANPPANHEMIVCFSNRLCRSHQGSCQIPACWSVRRGIDVRCFRAREPHSGRACNPCANFAGMSWTQRDSVRHFVQRASSLLQVLACVL
jgi:hypothetical protein